MDSLLHPVASLITTTDDAAASGEPTASTNRSKLARAVVVLAIGAVVAYAISRFLDRSESIRFEDDAEVVPVVEDAVEDLTPEDGDEGTGEDDRTDREHADAEDDDLQSETSVEVTEDDRSPEEIVERSREDVPEPGEMAVDDQVADELLEEGDETSEGNEEEDDGGDGDDSAADSDDAADDERLE